MTRVLEGLSLCTETSTKNGVQEFHLSIAKLYTYRRKYKYITGISYILGLVPGIAEQLLAVNLETIDEETVFFQLQSVFAHLMESRLQYFVPDRWDSRSLDPEILHTVRILIRKSWFMIPEPGCILRMLL